MLKRLTTVDYLHEIRALIATPDRWYQGTGFALDAEGEICRPKDEKAQQWCLYGALERILGEEQPLEAEGSPWGSAAPPMPIVDAERLVKRGLAYRKLLMAIPGGDSVTRFNERLDTTHADVLAVIDRAIAACAP